MAKRVEGWSSGMHFLMDWRWMDCLRNGLQWAQIDNDFMMHIADLHNKPDDFSIEHRNLTP